MQLAAAVPAERDDHEGGRRESGRPGVGHDEPGERLHHAVDHPGVRADGLLARRALDVHGLEGFQPLGEDGAEELEPETSPILGSVGSRLGAPGPAIQLARHDGKPSSPERVSNEGPAPLDPVHPA
jgi:hypothetical protein